MPVFEYCDFVTVEKWEGHIQLLNYATIGVCLAMALETNNHFLFWEYS